MATKKSPSKTINPLHFEDLEPHRFEDLVRQLIYDFKNWQSIEATGRSGSDDGFDVRAWEKVAEIINRDDEDVEEIGSHPMEGHLWMIQCKREKELGPTRIKKIIEDGVSEGQPPYGYILAASVNFSKKSYDSFRDILRIKGVSEFYLWGKAELEDMLYLPKNDRVLFTFFGFSLVTRRQSKTSERKFVINNKNKLARALSEGEQSQIIHKSVLIRDVNDENYPYKERCIDFSQDPRWEEHVAFQHHPLGLCFHLREFFAYVDDEKKEYDYTEIVDLINRPTELRHRHQPDDFQLRRRVEDFWKHLPKNNQCHFLIDGILRYEDMLVIDDKGDGLYDIPHIFVDPRPNLKSLFRTREALKIGNEPNYFDKEEYKRVKIFPSEFPESKLGIFYKNKSIQWDPETLRLFNLGRDEICFLFDHEGKYSFLNVDDVIPVAGGKMGSENLYIKITQKYKKTVKEFIAKNQGFFVRSSIENQTGKKVDDLDEIEVFEFERIYEWALKN